MNILINIIFSFKKQLIIKKYFAQVHKGLADPLDVLVALDTLVLTFFYIFDAYSLVMIKFICL